MFCSHNGTLDSVPAKGVIIKVEDLSVLPKFRLSPYLVRGFQLHTLLPSCIEFNSFIKKYREKAK